MRRLTTARVVLVALLLLPCQSVVSAQEKGLDGEKEPSQPGWTGAGAGSSETTAAKPGGVDGLGNPLLGGERRPLYRLRSSDVLEITFTVSPEFNQMRTVQPDGYVTLKDAEVVFAEGLTLVEFREAVQRAYRGYLHEPQVAVALKEFEHPYFIVGGEVGPSCPPRDRSAYPAARWPLPARSLSPRSGDKTSACRRRDRYRSPGHRSGTRNLRSPTSGRRKAGRS